VQKQAEKETDREMILSWPVSAYLSPAPPLSLHKRKKQPETSPENLNLNGQNSNRY
jgi:hypothetical protein